MAKAVRAKSPFYDLRNRRAVTAGQIFDAKDPVVKGREDFFEDVDEVVERATQAPGERRRLGRKKEPDPYPEQDRSGPNQSVPDPENDDPKDQPNDSKPDPDNDDPPGYPNDSEPDPDAREGESKHGVKGDPEKSVTAEDTLERHAKARGTAAKKTTRKKTTRRASK